ncbi:MAG TPA: hypothetical protein VL053_08910 [Arachidicoccus sp.]|nr:hypothetical protein [Arachidicoccus sp.]
MDISVKKNSVLKDAVMEETHACGIITAKPERSPTGIDIGGYPSLLASIILNGDASRIIDEKFHPGHRILCQTGRNNGVSPYNKAVNSIYPPIGSGFLFSVSHSPDILAYKI